jgi:hypothetical protein
MGLGTGVVEDYVHTWLDEFTKQYREEGLDLALQYRSEPILEEEAIRSLDSIAEAQQQYQAHGLDVDWDGAYQRLQKDWWAHQREPFEGEVDELPAEDRDLAITIDGEEHTAEVYVHGIVHGFEEYAPMEDEMKEFLREETDRILDRGGAFVYTEQNFPELFFPEYADQHDNFEEMSDIDWLEEQEGDTRMKGLKGFFAVAKPLNHYMIEAAGRLSQIPQEYQPRFLDQITTLHESLESREGLMDAHNTRAAGRLPAALQNDYFTRGSKEFELDDAGDVVSMAVEKEAFRFLHQIVKGRSDEMARYAVENTFDDDVDEIHMIVGLGHQQDILDYLDELEKEDVREIRASD